MKVTFTDSFFKSLDTMRRHDTWWYKTYHAIRYDIPRFFKTVWLFRKELYGYYEWDHTYPMNMFKRGLILLSDHIEEHGHEIDTPRKKKVEKMRRSIELLELHTSGDYIELAEKELGYVCNTEYIFGDGEPKKIKEANRKLYDLSTKIEEETWIELFKILQGQDYKDFGNMFDKNKDLEETALLYDEWFDGSGLKGWWN